MFDIAPEQGLFGLFVSAFVSATLLPGASELLLVAMLRRFPDLWWSAIAVATLGNTLGAATSYLIGRLIPNRAESRALAWLRRHGYAALLFTWVPVVGDALPVAAGWLRFHAVAALAVIAVGKLARYLVVAGGWSVLAPLVL
jgi:membrane protein YqaA with SNARE-associated domain